MKKTKLTKLEKHFIETVELSPEEIAKELNRSIDQINQYLNDKDTKKRMQERINKFLSSKKGAYVLNKTGAEIDDVLPKTKNRNTDCIHYTK